MSQRSDHLGYRTDIDGLRSLAILPILLFHAGMRELRGGFIGVDIFFVISGFLITRIILTELGGREFSVLNFYHRRFARILPALFLVLAAVLVVGMVMFELPLERQDLLRSTAASAVFSSNIYFWAHTDYFATAGESQPLLHTWSLAVEEQFYILYPLVLIALYRWGPKALRLGLIVLAIASFGAGLAIDQVSTTASFYLLPTRIWELALGGLATLGAFPRVEGRAARDVLAASGGLLILIGLVTITQGSGFPAPWALLPCGGAALLIAYGERTLAGRALSLYPIRWIGMISYSLYLWHWPIITFYRLTFGSKLDRLDTVVLVVASIFAAAVSFYLVEQPLLRRMRHAVPRRVVFASLAVVAVTGAASAGLAGAVGRMRIDPDVRAIAAYTQYAGTPEHLWQYETGCFVSKRHDRLNYRRCVTIAPGRRNVAVVGDSHAAQYWRALSGRFADVSLSEVTASGCLPVLHATGESRCTEAMRHMFGPVVDSGKLDGIVLIGRWRPDMVDDLVATVRHLRERRIDVTVIGPTVEYEGEYPALLARALLAGDARSVERFRDRDRQALDEAMAPRIRAAGATYVSVYRAECPRGRCSLYAAPHVPIHFDYGHTTMPAARRLMRAVPRI